MTHCGHHQKVHSRESVDLHESRSNLRPRDEFAVAEADSFLVPVSFEMDDWRMMEAVSVTADRFQDPQELLRGPRMVQFVHETRVSRVGGTQYGLKQLCSRLKLSGRD